ncbi:NAD(P)H-nitrite reductase large subunit [Catalinimonas alkaloidigena]|uniref:NAD(P)/FAD-dependent oxidoreductase n=1 Tax=Catalinimonas alkaloidigena TaxID=1075417 RepID=UPI002405D760|nr:FAD-dependent oxidoreductase [Catalinimonas alkaloidigena]MDF9801209.1 NAD(P)H-nitrite reductase large subunit [Catalinimonas alkaloidigena]
MKKVCIVGNGIAGITAARHIRKQKSASEYSITVISAETQYFFSRTALMYIYMGHMLYEHTKPYEDWFWDKNDIQLVQDYVEKVDCQEKKLKLKAGGNLPYDILLLATGSKGNRAGWPGEELKGVQGMISKQDIDAMEENTKGIERGVIVGGGLIGIEMAECLHSREIPVSLLIRERAYWDHILPQQEAEMVSQHIRKHGIDLRENTNFKEIKGDENGRVKAAVTEDSEEIPCQFVGITIGVKPNIAFLKGSDIETDRGILVNEFLETNVPDVYAAGDCVQHKVAPAGRRNLEQIWYSGRMQGETVARTICGEKMKYVPGVFFNSAKFFDIEYQVYGEVNAQQKEDEEQFYWINTEKEVAFRVAFEKESGAVKGFNLMGIRYRHELCARWIKEKRDIGFVMQHLKEANFDPEFFKHYEPEIINKFNQDFPDRAVQPRKKNIIAALFGL